MTKILEINKNSPEEDKINQAAEVLKSGGTVVFPTETVYGLGANALDENAVKKIFAAKGRPSDNPLIIHIWDIGQASGLVSEIPGALHTLAEAFWPGPLTLVMKKSPKVPELVTAGLDTVGIRMPDHTIALALLKETGVPVAAPSANISGSPSPTRAEHVIKDMNGKVDIIIDGGDCIVGLESTVLDITGDTPVILRPGGITAEQIQEVLGKIAVDKHVYGKFDAQGVRPKSPGVKYRHYSPKAEVILVEGPVDQIAGEILRQARDFEAGGKKVGILATDQTKDWYPCGIVISAGDRNNPQTIAANIFKLLRQFDETGVDVILAEGIDKKGIGMAIMNRMIRAAGYNVIKLDKQQEE